MPDITDWVNERQNWYGVFNADIPVPPGNFLNALLTNDGGTTFDMATTADDWDYPVPDDAVTFVQRSLVAIQDKGIVPTKFGGENALANGCLIRCYDSDGTTLLKNWTEDFTLKANLDWALLAGPDAPVIDAGGTDDGMYVRWTHAKSGGMILLDEGQIFRVTTQDDLSGVTSMRWCLQGLTFEKGVFTDKLPRLTTGSF